MSFHFVDMGRSAVALAICVGIPLVGCGFPTEPGRRLVPSSIAGFEEGDPHVDVQVDGRSLTITVVTYGNACNEKGELRTAVSRESRTIQVLPHDWLLHREACDDILLTFKHSEVIDVGVEGVWTVVVTGLDISRRPFSEEYTVRVGAR